MEEKKDSKAGNFNDSNLTRLTPFSKEMDRQADYAGAIDRNITWLPAETEEPFFFTIENYIGSEMTLSDEDRSDFEDKLCALNYHWRQWAKSMLYHKIKDESTKLQMDELLEIQKEKEKIKRGRFLVELPDPSRILPRWAFHDWSGSKVKIRSYYTLLARAEEKRRQEFRAKTIQQGSDSEDTDYEPPEKFAPILDRLSTKITFCGEFGVDVSITKHQWKLIKLRTQMNKMPFCYEGDYVRLPIKNFLLGNSALVYVFPKESTKQTKQMRLENIVRNLCKTVTVKGCVTFKGVFVDYDKVFEEWTKTDIVAN